MSFERRKVRIGKVVSDKMDKTLVVVFEWSRAHRIYKKAVKRQSRFKVHDGANAGKTGDLVRIVESRPYSKTKKWRLDEVLHREEIAEIQPDEITVEDESVLVAQRETPADQVAAEDAPAAVAEAEVIVAAEAEEVVESEEAAEEPEAEVASEEQEAVADEPVAEVEQEQEAVAEVEEQEPEAEVESTEEPEEESSEPAEAEGEEEEKQE